jgi:hypothetical protein
MEFLPQLVTDSAILASGAVETITVSATISAMPEVVGASIEGGLIASEALAPQYLQDAKANAAKNNYNKKPCAGDLSAIDNASNTINKTPLGTLTPKTLQQGIANANVLNGVGSTTLRSSLFANSLGLTAAVGKFGGQTIDTALKLGTDGPGIKNNALAQFNGRNIYVDPSDLSGAAANYYVNQATIAHEAIHNITGLSDRDIQDALNLPHALSQNITGKLKQDCWK